MAKLNGKSVQFYIVNVSDVLITGQIDGSISCTNGVIESTDKASTSRVILGQTVPSYTIEMSIHFDAADAAQDLIRAAISAGTSINVKRFDSGSEVADASGYVSEYNIGLPNNDIITATATVEMTGDCSAFL